MDLTKVNIYDDVSLQTVLLNISEFINFANKYGHEDDILDDMDLSTEAWDKSCHILNLLEKEIDKKEKDGFWVDFEEDSITLMDGDEELVMWTEDEWIEDPEVVFPICNAILLGFTKGAEEIKRRLGFPKEVAEEEIICPLCDEPMDYRALDNGDDKLTHIWVCSACPNIMFEFYDMSDLKALQKYLSRSGKES